MEKQSLSDDQALAGVPGLRDGDLLRQQCLIGGIWMGEPTVGVVNPATGATFARVPNFGKAETGAAIAAAEKALPAWRQRTAADRSAVLRRWFELIMGAQDDLALILTTEQGKPLAEARGEIAYAASFVEWFGEQAKRIDGQVIPSHRGDSRIVVLRQPIGVTAAVTPWNFPAAMITRKAAPALAAGCTMVLKPALQTPLSAFALAVLAERAGVPPGVFNVVTGNSREIGDEITANPIVRKLSFTGSTEVGRLLMRKCADTIKKLSLELGGNAPFLVFDDADIDAAVEGAIVAKYRNSGQTCVCVNRLLVQRSVAEEFAVKLAGAAGKLRVGNGTEAGVTQGPLIDEPAIAKVEMLVADALDKGARLLAGGKRAARGGLFYEPTVMTDCTTDMLIAHEEAFGPVAPIFVFDSEAEALRIANASEFGLAGYFYSQNLSRVWRVAEALETGMVGINTGLISTEVAPFGGIKQSGLGREGSSHGIEDYVELKYLCMGGISQTAPGEEDMGEQV